MEAMASADPDSSSGAFSSELTIAHGAINIRHALDSARSAMMELISMIAYVLHNV